MSERAAVTPSMRLVFVSAARRWTGGERCMAAVADGMARRGHDVTFTYDPRGPVGARLSDRVSAYPIRIRNDADPAAIMRLRRLIARTGADVVCVNTARELKVGGAAARLARRGAVVNRKGAGDALYDGAVDRLVYRALLDVLVRDSQHGVDMVRDRNPWFTRPVLRARNGVDVESLSRIEPAPRDAFGAGPDELLLVTSDRGGRRAGAPFIAEAARMAASRGDGPPIHLVVLGSSPAAGDGGSEIRRAQDDGVRVTFLGPRPPRESLSILAAGDAYVRASWSDGIPFAVLEAMALGRPVVATAVGGVPEAVIHEETGFLVPADDAAAMAGALERLRSDPELRARMGAAGRHRAATEFGEERMLDDYEAAFRLALTTRCGTLLHKVLDTRARGA